MKQFNMIDLRTEWEQLTTPELEALLHAELNRKPPDDEAVLTLLHILEEREPELPLQLSRREEEAWARYRKKRTSRKPRTIRFGRWLSVAASIALIAGILFTVVPQQAEAETFWEMLQRMTTSVLEFFSGEGKKAEFEYVFETDNPGLQQVYDAVVELGVTEPVVPMWLPEECEISRCEGKNTPVTKGVFAAFSYGDDEVIYELEVYSSEPAHQYYKDDSFYESYELEGAIFYISRNNERWSVVWTIDNIECHITLDCHEDTLRRILKTIYVMEE